MNEVLELSSPDADTDVLTMDVLVVGAGISGLYQLYALRQLGFDARIVEAGGGVGGTWYWNCYPGARFDSESYSYAYSFSEELLQEWDWAEHFAGQPETERYLNYVADKFDLRRHIVFNQRVKSAVFDEQSNRWNVETESGLRANTRFIVLAVGILSAPNIAIPGVEDFEGESFHTARWPHQPVDFAGKRVGVIGTGSTGIQIIPEIAPQVGQLTVFQRTPNYIPPLLNSDISAAEQQEIKEKHAELFARCKATFASFPQDYDPRRTFDLTPEERQAFYEQIWAEPGFNKVFNVFYDVTLDAAANAEYAEFVRSKIRARVKDPVVAEMLVPTDHPFGGKRVPLETGYYEAFNRDNVLLVDVKTDPIRCITPHGVQTGTEHYDLDVIIYATGFDAVTGEITRMDIRGVGGQGLKEKWAEEGNSSYLTLQTHGFPNLFIANGSVFCNFTRCAEVVGNWVSACIDYMGGLGYSRIEATAEAEAAWTEHASAVTEGLLFLETDSWFVGSNVEGKKRSFLFYAGGAPAYRERIEQVAAHGYEGFALS